MYFKIFIKRMITSKTFIETCKNGDIVLLQKRTLFSKLFYKYNSVGIVIIDPFIDNQLYKGVYVLEITINILIIPIEDIFIK